MSNPREKIDARVFCELEGVEPRLAAAICYKYKNESHRPGQWRKMIGVVLKK